MLQLILGRAGSGKTTELYRRIGQVAEAGGQAILLVPEQFSFENERELYLRLGPELSSRVEVLGFGRLCDNVFRYYGGLVWDGGDMELLSFYKRAIALRRGLTALQRGEFRLLCAKRGSGLLAFARECAEERVRVYINCSDSAADCEVEGETLFSEGLGGGKIGPYGFAVTLERG